MLALLLAACTAPGTIDAEPRPCGAGFARAADGLCYEVDGDTGDTADTADTDSGGDSGTETGDSGETGETGDTGEPRPDADGDGVPDELDCNDERADVYPGAPDDTMDGIDQDCDGADFDPCAVPQGSARFVEERVVVTAAGTVTMEMDGDAVLCSFTCDADWLVALGAAVADCDENPKPPLPYTMPGETFYLCATAVSPGAEVDATCTAHTSAGFKSVTLSWR